MKRRNRSRIFKNQLVATQKMVVRGALCLIGLTLFVIFLFGDHGLFQLYKLKQEKNDIKKQISQFRKEKEKLMSEKNRLGNDLDYIEKLAREKYRMAKPGEQVFKVIQVDDSTRKK